MCMESNLYDELYSLQRKNVRRDICMYGSDAIQMISIYVDVCALMEIRNIVISVRQA